MSEIYNFSVKTRKGNIIKHYEPMTKPEKIEQDIKGLI